MTLWRPIAEADKGLALFIRGSGPFLSLKIGDIVEAEVLEIVSGNRVLINLKNKVIEAKTEVPLKVGERLLLKVEGKDDEVRLRLVKDATRPPRWFKGSISSALNNIKGVKPDIKGLGVLRHILSRIPDGVKEGLEGDSILKRLPLPMEGLTGNALRGLFESSGVFFETKLRLLVLKYMEENILKQDEIENPHKGLKEGDRRERVANNLSIKEELAEIIKADLKGSLLKLKGLLRDSVFVEHLVKDGIKPQELSNLIDRLVETIEYHQLHSSLSESLQSFLPLLWEALRDGGLIFKRDSSGRGSYYCIIRLELERMGRMVIWVIMQEEGFHISFITDNKTSLKFLENQLSFLKERFVASGLKLGSLMVRYEERIDFKAIPQGLDIRI